MAKPGGQGSSLALRSPLRSLAAALPGRFVSLFRVTFAGERDHLSNLQPTRSRKMRVYSVSMISVLSSLVLLGCGVEDEDSAGLMADESADAQADAPALGSTQQAVSWSGSTHSCTGGTCYVDFGVTTNRTCFLGGIYGSLNDASASILRYADGRFKLRLGSPAGQRIAATAICVSGNTNTAEGFWTGGNAATPITGTVTATRRCFLTQIDNNVVVRGFDTTSDYARVWKDSAGKWYVGGSLSGGAGTRASAVCIDVPGDHGTWGIVSNPGAGNTVAFDLAEDIGGVACGLTKLGGNFTTNSTSDGLGVDYNAGTRFWNIKAINGKQAAASCVR
jgi:hypothetical protein